LQNIQSKIYVIRGQRVMLDFDLAAMYGVKTGSPAVPSLSDNISLLLFGS
jgi:hypothetical protein